MTDLTIKELLSMMVNVYILQLKKVHQFVLLGMV